MPNGDAAFTFLRARGIRTIISVDGAFPDVETAERYGMRYVHLPIGYDGLSDEEVRRLARAVRDLPKPIYIHCFHGRHRSPAAACTALIALGKMTPEEGLAFLEQAGTSPSYTGLWASVRNARRIPDEILDATPADFPARAMVSSVVNAMVAIDRAFDHLVEMRDWEWSPIAHHPDLDPIHEAEVLAEHLAVLRKELDSILDAIPMTAEDSSPTRPLSASRWRAENRAGFVELSSLMDSSHCAAMALAATLQRRDYPAATDRLDTLEASCQACHMKYRN